MGGLRLVGGKARVPPRVAIHKAAIEVALCCAKGDPPTATEIQGRGYRRATIDDIREGYPGSGVIHVRFDDLPACDISGAWVFSDDIKVMPHVELSNRFTFKDGDTVEIHLNGYIQGDDVLLVVNWSN